MSRKHCAFTLTEILVVISIIGVLVSMLLPAIQHAREASRRAVCSANMSQAAKAIITYDARKGFLPASRTLAPAGNIQNWVVPVLPFLDRQDLNDTIRAANGFTGTVAQEPIPVLLCPDDPEIRQKGVLSYRVNGGRANGTWRDPRSGTVYQNHDWVTNGLFVDLATAGSPCDHWTPLPGDARPALVDQNKSNLDRVKDGTGTTIMLAENLITLSRMPQGVSLWSAAGTEEASSVLWSPDPTTSDFVGLNRDETVSGGQPSATIWWARPASYHPGGFLVAFADGSVRFMADVIEYRVYSVLMTSDGAKVREPSTCASDCPWQTSGNLAFPGTKF